MNNNVYIVVVTEEFTGIEKMEGVYSTEEKAKACVAELEQEYMGCREVYIQIEKHQVL